MRATPSSCKLRPRVTFCRRRFASIRLFLRTPLSIQPKQDSHCPNPIIHTQNAREKSPRNRRRKKSGDKRLKRQTRRIPTMPNRRRIPGPRRPIPKHKQEFFNADCVACRDAHTLKAWQPRQSRAHITAHRRQTVSTIGQPAPRSCGRPRGRSRGQISHSPMQDFCSTATRR
jgi:hypothetical protein